MRPFLLILFAACSSSTAPPDVPTGGGDDTAPDLPPDPLPATFDEALFLGERDALVYAPAGIDRASGTPVVLNFHGATPSFAPASESHAIITEMKPHALEHSYIVAFPRARTFDGTQYWPDPAIDDADLIFVEALLDELDSRFGIDRDRVYATGFSSGGYLSYALGCLRPDLVAAIAPVAGATNSVACPPSSPMPLLAFHGTADARVDVDDDRDTVATWATAAGCDDTPTDEVIGDTTCSRWTGCDGDLAVGLCVSEGAGHTWPGSQGSETVLTTTGEGVTSFDVVATERIAAWFGLSAP